MIDGETSPDFIDPLVERVEPRVKAAVVEMEQAPDQDEAKDPVMALDVGEYKLDRVTDRRKNA
jgi:hypothetical protein